MQFSVLQNAVIFRGAFGDLSSFIDNQIKKDLRPSELSQSNNEVYDANFRNSNQVNVDPKNPIVEEVRRLSKIANEEYFKINISKYSSENHFIQYDVNGKFERHTDIVWKADVNDLDKKPIRKITTITLLNEDFTGGKLALWYMGERYSFVFNAGDVISFPSYVSHKVDPIESGIRYSLVSWSYGEF